jgi:glycerol-3-phosphate acyltransferase PlsY
MTGAGALLGHIYPVYYGFRGGKGVATFYGALLGFNWLAGLGALAIWGLAALVTKISSLSALTSILASPFLTWQLGGSKELTATVALMAMLIYWRHRSNIRNIIEGKENRIGPKPK